MLDLDDEPIGKKVGGRVYLHVETLAYASPTLQSWVAHACRLTGKAEKIDFNVVKVDPERQRISLLVYDDFFDDAFPVLRHTWGVDLESNRTWSRSFVETVNPPILHRKELLLFPAHPRYGEFAELTTQLDAKRLLEKKGIGTKQQWFELLRQRGYRVEGHQLVYEGGDEEETESPQIHRHRTALKRSDLSAPVQCLANSGFLEGDRTFFDYGCGRGDDVRLLREAGFDAAGWDPHFNSDAPLQNADVVNLGYVINVIDEPGERAEVLLNAFQLSRIVLCVAAMLTGRRTQRFDTHGDGVLTQRGTFQKYFAQPELAGFIESVLEEEPIAVAPGIFFIFRDKNEEQRYLFRRYGGRRQNIGFRGGIEEKEATFLYERHEALLKPVAEMWLTTGRPPERIEVPDTEGIEKEFGSVRRALLVIARALGDEVLQAAKDSRIEDLTVAFAMRQFEARRTYKALPEELKRDVKRLVGSQKAMKALAYDALLASGQVENLVEACKTAAEQGLGLLTEENQLTFAPMYGGVLPPVLRIFLECGLKLFGDLGSIDLVKIHAETKKLTLMMFDDFIESPLPRLLERTKIDLASRQIRFYDYGADYEPPFLYLKSRFIGSDFPHYEEQLAFDRRMLELGLVDAVGEGPRANELGQKIQRLGLAVRGFEMVYKEGVPSLDEPCGKYLRFRDLVECGETQRRTGIENIPRELATYQALRNLATEVLDPIMDYFGGIELTYGFCSRELAAKIPARIDPKLDQHAAYEKNRAGRQISPRGGAAVDFLVRDENMLEVAQWIVQNTGFDRLYFYGHDKPLHVSAGQEQKRQIVLMVERDAGRLVPRVIKEDQFLGLTE